jgi:ATP-binding cassette subfamily B protein
MSALVAESLSVSGIMLGKTMGRGDDLADRFTTESQGIADLEVRSRMAGRWTMGTIQFVFSVLPALIYWFAGQSFVGHSIEIGTVVAFTTLQTRLLFPIQSLLGVQADMEASLALFDRIFEYLDLPVDIVEAPNPVELRPKELLGEVRFEDVWFKYGGEGSDREEGWTLKGIGLDIPAGTRTAVVGETGAGKTTLGYLAARLYEPQRGRVTIDGVDVRDASLSSLAATVGVVSQETYLFHASVRENLRFARPDATDQEIEDAARTARIHDLIASLPDGYDTLVGERGYRRGEAADGDRPNGAAQPTGAGARRGDELARHTDRSGGAGLAGGAGGGPDDDHDRAPAVDRPGRRSDRGARSRRDRRARHAR